MERLHIVIDEELPTVYGCVQGGHAVAEWMIKNPTDSKRWNNDYLIYLKGDINKLKYKLDLYNIDYTEFKEPDLNNQTTSIAMLGNSKFIKNLKTI